MLKVPCLSCVQTTKFPMYRNHSWNVIYSYSYTVFLAHQCFCLCHLAILYWKCAWNVIYTFTENRKYFLCTGHRQCAWNFTLHCISEMCLGNVHVSIMSWTGNVNYFTHFLRFANPRNLWFLLESHTCAHADVHMDAHTNTYLRHIQIERVHDWAWAYLHKLLVFKEYV